MNFYVKSDIVNANDDLNLYAVLDHHFKNRKVKDDVIFGGMDRIADFLKEGCQFCIAIGNNKVRQKLMLEFNIPLDRYIALIHPTAVISPSGLVGRGTVVMPNTVISADAIVGNRCIVNSGSVIEHDNRLEDFVHVSPNSYTCWNCYSRRRAASGLWDDCDTWKSGVLLGL